jgi:NAD(P)-dependent dehydrogenase (short-subunit alcohol dehydrogenase family)
LQDDMKGKVVIITGATSGIGQIAAEALARMGARIVQIARDHDRGQAAMKRLAEVAPEIAHSIYYADLSLLGEMKRVGAEIAAAEPHIDVLINNAGAVFATRQLTQDGLERTFALNHMSYFVLTEMLRARLVASAPARVVNTASNAHRGTGLDLNDLQSANTHQGLLARVIYLGPGLQLYGRSKLCNILFTRELARRLAGTGVTANSHHPGFVDSRFGDASGGLLTWGIRLWKRILAISPEQGAKTMTYLASSPVVGTVTGEYFYKSRPVRPSRAAQDDAMAKRLWEESERLLKASS